MKDQNNTIKAKTAEVMKLNSDLNCDKREFVAENLSGLILHVAARNGD